VFSRARRSYWIFALDIVAQAFREIHAQAIRGGMKSAASLKDRITEARWSINKGEYKPAALRRRTRLHFLLLLAFGKRVISQARKLVNRVARFLFRCYIAAMATVENKVITTAEFAGLMSVSYHCAIRWLRKGIVPGAVKRSFGKVHYWEIPIDALNMKRPKGGRPRKVRQNGRID